MKKKIILTGIIILIIIGAVLSSITYFNKPKMISLSHDKILIKNQIVTELISTIDTDNYKKYENLTSGKLKSRDIFIKLQNSMNTFGKLHNLTFEHGLEIKKFKVLLYTGDFTNEKKVEFTVTINEEDKIAGFYFK